MTLGLGMERQNEAMWHLTSASDTVTTGISLFAADLFGEIPLPGNKAWTFYMGYFQYDFGPNYLRVIGFNNVGSGLNSQGTFSGTGNAWPAIGTGRTGYFQVGHAWTLSGRKERIQPFFSAQLSEYDKLEEPVTFLKEGLIYCWTDNGPN